MSTPGRNLVEIANDGSNLIRRRFEYGVQWAFAHVAVPGFNLAENGWRAYL
jgi:hypothetical protein